MGVPALMPSIINEWQTMRNIDLIPLELDMIIAIENEYMSFVSKKLSERT